MKLQVLGLLAGAVLLSAALFFLGYRAGREAAIAETPEGFFGFVGVVDEVNVDVGEEIVGAAVRVPYGAEVPRSFCRFRAVEGSPDGALLRSSHGKAVFVEAELR